jgi:myosin heavy subunit
MQRMGIHAKDQLATFAVLAAVLRLGNVAFEPVRSTPHRPMYPSNTQSDSWRFAADLIPGSDFIPSAVQAPRT